MKCKKYDQAWFDNKYLQLLKENCLPKQKLQKLIEFMKLAKKYNIIPKASKESKEKIVREDFGIAKSNSAVRNRKSRLKRKRNKRK